MKITAFYPALITNDAASAIRSIEKFGFRIVHERKNIIDEGDTEYVLENESGSRFDIVHNPHTDHDYYSTRVNVDDFDEALKLYAEDGFTVIMGPQILPDSKNAVLAAPGKLEIMLMQHLK